MVSLTKPLSLLLLSSWTLTALLFTTIDALNASASWTQIIASSTLLTFLICRLLVKSSENDTGSLAHTITTAHKRSKPAALTLLVLSVSWLWELIFKSLVLLFVTLFGGVFAAVLYGDFEVDSNGNGSGSGEGYASSSYSYATTPSAFPSATLMSAYSYVPTYTYTTKSIPSAANMIEFALETASAAASAMPPAVQDMNHDRSQAAQALSSLEEFSQENGSGLEGDDLLALFRMIPPRLFVYVFAAVWFNFVSLGCYVLLQAWRGVRGVLGGQTQIQTLTRGGHGQGHGQLREPPQREVGLPAQDAGEKGIVEGQGQGEVGVEHPVLN